MCGNNLKQIITFPTRGNATLDLIPTNIQDHYPACKLSGRPGVMTPKIAVGRPELHSRSSVGRPDLLPLNLSLTLKTFSTCFEVHQPSK